jgi:hypothetical protein
MTSCGAGTWTARRRAAAHAVLVVVASGVEIREWGQGERQIWPLWKSSSGWRFAELEERRAIREIRGA